MLDLWCAAVIFGIYSFIGFCLCGIKITGIFNIGIRFWRLTSFLFPRVFPCDVSASVSPASYIETMLSVPVLRNVRSSIPSSYPHVFEPGHVSVCSPPTLMGITSLKALPYLMTLLLMRTYFMKGLVPLGTWFQKSFITL